MCVLALLKIVAQTARREFRFLRNTQSALPARHAVRMSARIRSRSPQPYHLASTSEGLRGLYPTPALHDELSFSPHVHTRVDHKFAGHVHATHTLVQSVALKPKIIMCSTCNLWMGQCIRKGLRRPCEGTPTSHHRMCFSRLIDGEYPDPRGSFGHLDNRLVHDEGADYPQHQG